MRQAAGLVGQLLPRGILFGGGRTLDVNVF